MMLRDMIPTQTVLEMKPARDSVPERIHIDTLIRLRTMSGLQMNLFEGYHTACPMLERASIYSEGTSSRTSSTSSPIYPSTDYIT